MADEQGDVKSAEPSAPQEQPEPEASSAKSLADILDIPVEAQTQIFGKEESGEEQVTSNEDESQRAQGEQRDTDDGPEPAEEGSGEPAGAEGDGEPADPNADTDGDPNADPDGKAQSPFKDPRVQQRIDKEVRRRKREEERADAAEAELARRDGQKQENRGAEAAPTLESIRNERELNQVVSRAQTLLDYCDANAEGVEVGEGDQKRFVEPAEIAKWRRDAERTLLKAEPTRTRIRDFTAQQQHWNSKAQEIYPELFPSQENLKSGEVSEEFSYACALVQAAPQVFGSLPEANLLLGDLAFSKLCRDNPAGAIEKLQKRLEDGKTSNVQRSTFNGRNGNPQPSTINSQRSSDIPPNLRRKQPPLAPATARPPSGQARPNAQKRVDEAKNNLVNDPDGGATALTEVFAAQEAVTKPSRLVKV